MTLSNQNSYVYRDGNGLTTEFPFPFRCLAETHVRLSRIYENGEVFPVPEGQYSVDLLDVGGSVTTAFPDGPLAVGQSLYIYRETPIDQLISVSNQTAYNPQVVTHVWDKLTAISQELQAILDRAVVGPPGQDITDLLNDLLNAVLRAQAWAESPINPDPDDPNSKSAKTWAGESEADADRAELAAAAMNVRQVADTTALAALPTTQWKAGLLSSGASYLFDAGNRSAQITAGDPRYVAPASDPTGASGAWALRDRVFANAEDIGVVTGTVSDGVALINAQRINKWLSSADSRIFDWRDDEIGIAETIRLGRDGNGIVGVSGGTLFGAVTAGARAKWQGVAGGTMVLARNNLTTVDLDSPSVYGLTLDGNALAGVGLEFSGVMKPMGDALHVRNLRDNSASYAYQFRHNPDASGGQVNCCYGGRFGSLTCQVAGAANGFLFTGLSGAPGTGVTFCQFGYCHVTCANGFAFLFQKGDDNVFTQIGVSRAAGGTGGQLLFNSQKANALVWVGNVYLNINLSKTDGAAMEIAVSDDATMGNSITYNGVDFMPSLVLAGGSIRSHNKWTFLGQSNYVGGWTNRPREDLFGPRFPNIDVAAQDVLDHYQERTSDLPGIAFGGASVGVVYGARSMRSVRIGGVVIVSGSITLSNKGSSTGAATITGLPVNATIAGAISIGYYANLASAFAAAPIGSAGASGSIALRKAGAATAADMTNADFTNTTRIDFSVTYVVA